MLVRDAVEADVAAICDLYNALVTTTTVAWAEEPEPLAELSAWFARQRAGGRPVLVAEEGGALVGYCSFGDFRDTRRWPGYRFTAEHTVHVREDHWGRGIGRALMEGLIERAASAGVHVLVAAVDGDNDASIRFHEHLGFVTVARMPEVGRKFGRWLDLVLLQRIVTPSSGPR